MKIRLAGRRGEALEAFWAGQTDAAHALAAMRAKAVAPKPQPKKCWLCDGLGQVVTGDAAQDSRSSRIVDGPVKAEPCMACLGTCEEK